MEPPANGRVEGKQREAVERLHDQLRQSVAALVTSEDWQQALATAVRFRHYSFANTQLIAAQAAAQGFTPTRVTGYRTWRDLDRQVRRGERGLAILAPIVRNVAGEDGTEEKRKVVGFRPVHVFDISQTDGEPLPEVRPVLLEGDLPAHWDRVADLIVASGFSLHVGDSDRLGEANGITDMVNHQVVVKESLSGAQRFKTAVHELAHGRLHEPGAQGRPNCRGVVEVEAESVAYMVCASVGIDATDYSLPYVASWSGGDVEKVTTTANRAIECARDVIDQLEHDRQLEPAAVTSNSTITVGGRSQEIWEMAIEPAILADRNGDLEQVLRSAQTFYQERLHHRSANTAQKYLDRRHITAESALQWRLGYAPQSWDALTQHLTREGFDEELVLGAGVAGRARSGRLYDLMRGRLIFPVLDETGAPRGFAGRLIAGKGPRYLNGPETALYTKRSLLYGLDLAQPGITKIGQAIVVEGYTDVVAAHQTGFTNVAGTGGTALTEQHLDLLARTTTNVVLAFDGDPAGLQAIERSAGLLHNTPLQIRVAALPSGQDPAAILTSSEPDRFNAAIDQARPIAWHLIDAILQQHNLEELGGATRAVISAAPLIDSLHPDRRSEAVAYLANRLGHDPTAVASTIQRYANRPSRRRGQSLSRGLA